MDARTFMRVINEVRVRIERVLMRLFVYGNRRLLCRRPVEVEIRVDEDCRVLASCERLHVFAAGATYQEAIDSLHEQVVYFHEEYMALREEEVIGRAVEIRHAYCEHFELTRNN